jgi:hypothetical protein
VLGTLLDLTSLLARLLDTGSRSHDDLQQKGSTQAKEVIVLQLQLLRRARMFEGPCETSYRLRIKDRNYERQVGSLDYADLISGIHIILNPDSFNSLAHEFRETKKHLH